MDLSSDSDIDVAYEMHIHSFTFEFEGPAVDHLCGRQKSAGGKSRFHSAVENTREPTVKGPINVCPFFEHRPIAPALGRLVRSERARFPGKELWSSMPKSCD